MGRVATQWKTRSIAAALAAIVGACSPGAPTSSSTVGSEPSQTPASARPAPPDRSAEALTPSPAAATLAAAPGGCPGPEPRPQAVADFIGPVVLGPPLWAGVYATYEPPRNAYSAPDAPWTEHGWRIKILFLLEPGHDQPVDVVGVGVGATAGATAFAVQGGGPSRVATFDPRHPAIPVTHAGWREYPTYAYFPSAGCYLLTAVWAGGRSHLGFGLGR